jgi:hypothetical protein
VKRQPTEYERFRHWLRFDVWFPLVQAKRRIVRALRIRLGLTIPRDPGAPMVIADMGPYRMVNKPKEMRFAVEHVALREIVAYCNYNTMICRPRWSVECLHFMTEKHRRDFELAFKDAFPQSDSTRLATDL